jgi:transposase
MFTQKIFEVALGISTPWYIQGLAFEPSQRKLNSVSVDMWPAFIRGITDYLPNAQITFKFHVFPHASTASKIRRKEQKTDPDLDQERPVCDSIRSESLLKNLIESAIEFLPGRSATNYVTFFF